MLSRFHQNSVMHGCMDYFCLACSAVLRTEEDVHLHIAKPVHKKNLVQTGYVGGLENRIRKVNKWYYCEWCNMLLPSVIKLNIHIHEENHIFNMTDGAEGDIKRTTFLKWVKNSVIAFDDLLINEKAWNSFIDNTCLVCDDEFNNAEIHKSGIVHNLKLIQAKVQVGPDNFISRKIDDTTHQCLTCNTVILRSEIMTHYENSEHSKLYLECRKAKRALINSTETENKPVCNKNSPEATVAFPTKTDIDSKKEDAKSIRTEIDPKLVEAKTDTKLVKNKTEANSDTTKKENRNKFHADINSSLGLRDYIRIFPENDQAVCFLCDWRFPCSEAQDHTKGEHHQTILEMQSIRQDRMKEKYEASKAEETAEQNKAATASNIIDTTKEEEALENEVNRDDIIDSIPVFQTCGIRIDLIGDKAFCAKCANYIDFNYKIIMAHIEDHQNSDKAASGREYPVVEQSHNKTDIKRSEEVAASGGEYPVVEQSLSKTDIKKSEETTAVEATKTNISEPPHVSPDVVDEIEVTKFTKRHEITLSATGDSAFCCICEKKVPPSMKSLQEHVKGNGHRLNKKTNNKKVRQARQERPDSPQYRTKPIQDYIETFSEVENSFKHDIVINDEITISYMSFSMITRTKDNGFRCLGCEQNFGQSEFDDHVHSKKHDRAIKYTNVVYSLDSEFVRELRPEEFHCGFCNLVEEGFPNLQQHLFSSAHDMNKTNAEWYLEEYKPELWSRRLAERQQVEMATLTAMIYARRPSS